MDGRKKRIYGNAHSQRRREWIATRTYTRPVLDIGCAEGYMTSAIPSTVTAVDAFPPEEFIADNATFLQATVYDLPFDDASFSTVCAFEMLEHLRNPLKALREMRRVCSERLYVTVPSYGAMRHTVGHHKDFRDIRSFVTKAGFTVVEYRVEYPYAYLEATVE